LECRSTSLSHQLTSRLNAYEMLAFDGEPVTGADELTVPPPADDRRVT
jgi:hypothetical protein